MVARDRAAQTPVLSRTGQQGERGFKAAACV